MATVARQRWFAELIDAGLEEEIFGPSDVLEQAKPEVLARCLPADLMAKVLTSALTAGKMSADGVLAVLTPALCAEHVPHAVLWACITAAAKRSGISEGNGGTAASDKRRVFLRRALERGLEQKILSPENVVAFATPEVLANHLPTDLKAKLIDAGLRADAMTPTLIVDTIGVDDLARNLPMSVTWNALAEAGARAAADGPMPGAGDAAEPVEAAAASRSGSGRAAAVPGKPTKGARLAAGSAPKRRAPTGGSSFEDDTNVNAEWADAADLEVVDEADVGAEPDAILKPGVLPGHDWTDDETNVGVDTSPGRGK